MPDTAEATAAPVDFTMGGRTLLLSPLADEDHGELDNWVRKRFVTLARESIPDNATQEERDEIFGAALREVASLGWFTETGRKMALTKAGTARLIWQSIRARQPQITYEWVLANMDGPSVDDFWDSFSLANRGSLTVEKKAAPAG